MTVDAGAERTGFALVPEVRERVAVAGRALARTAYLDWVVCAALVGAAVAPRVAALGAGYDVTQDEVNYVDLALSSARGQFPPRFENAPFVLHPPLFFLMGGGWDLIWGTGGGYFHLVDQTRMLNVVLAAVSVGLLYWIGKRVSSRSAGVITALLFVVDPFVLRQNGRAMLETDTLVWVLAGVLVLLPLFEGRGRHPNLRAVAAGLLLGLGVVTNDIAVILTLVPLVVVWWRRWGMPRRTSATAFVASLVPYGVYVVALSVVGGLQLFWTQERLGVERMLGIVQSTGFNRAGSPSLISTMLDQIGRFGLTYVLCAAGVAGALYLLLERHQSLAVRYLAVLTLAGTAALAYAVAFGTIEEQFLYYLYVPVLIVLPLAVRAWIRRATYVRDAKVVNGSPGDSAGHVPLWHGVTS